MEQMVQGILVVNTETIPGMMITETLGVVSGSTVRAKNVGRDITQGLRNIMGGELVKYTELLEESRQEAIGRMVAEAMGCLLYTSPSPRDKRQSRMPSSA